MKSCVVAVVGGGKSGKHTLVELLVSKSIPKEEIENIRGKGMHMKIGRKEIKKGLLECIYTPFSAGTVFMKDTFMLGIDVIIAVLDVSIGLVPEIQVLIKSAEEMQKGIIIFINKIDLFYHFFSKAELVGKIKGMLSEIKSGTSENIFVCIGTAKYNSAVYFGTIQNIDDSMEEINRRLKNIKELLYQSQETFSTFKKYIWDKKYLHLVDKEKHAYKRNKVESIIADVSVNAYLSLPLSHCIHEDLFSIKPKTNPDACIIGCTFQERQPGCIISTKHLGQKLKCIGGTEVLVKKQIEKDPILSSQRLFLVQVENPMELKKHFQRTLSFYNTIYVTINNLSEEDISSIYKQAFGWPAISVANSFNTLTLSSIDPFILESYIYTAKSILEKGNLSSPAYYIKKALKQRIEFNMEIDRSNLVFSLHSQIERNPVAQASTNRLFYIDKQNKCTLSVEGEPSTSSLTGRCIEIFKAALSMEQAERNSFPFAHTHISIIKSISNLAGSTPPQSNTSSDKLSARLVLVHLKRAAHTLIEKHTQIHLVISGARKVFLKKQIGNTNFTLPPRSDTYKLFSSISDHFRGSITSYSSSSKYFSTFTLTIPSSLFTEFISLVSSLFTTYSYSIYNVLYKETVLPEQLHL